MDFFDSLVWYDLLVVLVCYFGLFMMVNGSDDFYCRYMFVLMVVVVGVDKWVLVIQGGDYVFYVYIFSCLMVG